MLSVSELNLRKYIVERNGDCPMPIPASAQFGARMEPKRLIEHLISSVKFSVSGEGNLLESLIGCVCRINEESKKEYCADTILFQSRYSSYFERAEKERLEKLGIMYLLNSWEFPKECQDAFFVYSSVHDPAKYLLSARCLLFCP